MGSARRNLSLADADADADGSDLRCRENTFPGPRVASYQKVARRRLCSSRRCPTIMRLLPKSLVFALLLLLPTRTKVKVLASAQQQQDTRKVGVDICGCQPSQYEFTLNFDKVCDDSTVVSDPSKGVNETACLTEIRLRNNVPAAELVPVSIERIQILELGQNKEVIDQVVQNGPFEDGAKVNYTSAIATSDSFWTAAALPRGLQLVVTGTNAKDESVVHSFIITYTNDCDVFPVLTKGQQAGWVLISDVVDPPNTICPLSSGTPLPTVPVSKAPVTAVVPVPTPTVPISTVPTPTVPTPTVPITSRPVFPVSYAPAPARPVVPLPSVPSRTIPPHCPPVRRGRTEDDDYYKVGKAGGKAGGTYKKQRHAYTDSDRTMKKFDHDRRRRRGLTANFHGGECPEYIDHNVADDDDDDDDDEGKGGSSYRTDSGSYRGKASAVMKKKHDKSSKSMMYRLDSGSKGKGMSS